MAFACFVSCVADPRIKIRLTHRAFVLFFILNESGQKQRVALARAVFSNPDVSLLDDCFSALDATTGAHVFEHLFSLDSGALRGSGTILVTHALQFLPQVDYIMAMSAGSPSFCGTWTQLKTMGSDQSNDIVRDIQLSTSKTKKKHVGILHKEGLLEKEGLIMTVEERMYGISTLSIWVEWFKNAGGWTFFIVQFVFMVLDRGLYILSDW